jgi:hypothetical protein
MLLDALSRANSSSPQIASLLDAQPKTTSSRPAEKRAVGHYSVILTALSGLPAAARTLLSGLLEAANAGSASDAPAPAKALELPAEERLPSLVSRGSAYSDSDEAFGLAAHHAGLVLLHPFLSRFFEVVGIVASGERELPRRELPRAAALLAFLATGTEEALEHELTLVKSLLGLSPESPLPIADGLLRDTDRQEAEALLYAVIDHWSLLKSTSVEGLRSSFLQRRGLLRDAESGFRLQVESGPFDVLLSGLPWGIGIVKLPWMTRALFTEWVTP